jgi:hypothetical protein
VNPYDKRALQTVKAANTRKLSEENRDVAFRRIRDAERKTNAEKTARLRKLRLEKEAADRVEKKTSPTDREKIE